MINDLIRTIYEKKCFTIWTDYRFGSTLGYVYLPCWSLERVDVTRFEVSATTGILLEYQLACTYQRPLSTWLVVIKVNCGHVNVVISHIVTGMVTDVSPDVVPIVLYCKVVRWVLRAHIEFQSAPRWRLMTIVLVISANKLSAIGYDFWVEAESYLGLAVIVFKIWQLFWLSVDYGRYIAYRVCWAPLLQVSRIAEIQREWSRSIVKMVRWTNTVTLKHCQYEHGPLVIRHPCSIYSGYGTTYTG